MALADYRFRKTSASAALDALNDRLLTPATIVDQAGGQVVTINVDDSSEADLIDYMTELGYELIEGSGGAGVTGVSLDDHESRVDQTKLPVRVRDDDDLITAGWTDSGSGKNKTLTSPSDALSNNTFDGVTFTAGVDQRVLLTGIGTHNGIYFLETAADGGGQNAVLKRAYDADEDEEVLSGMDVPIVEGRAKKRTFRLTTTGTITVDSTSLTFESLSGKGNLVFGANKVGSTTSDRYLFPGYSDSLAQATPIQIRASRAGTLQNFRVRHNTPAGNGNDIVYTVRINGVASTITATLASDVADGSDLVNTELVAAGDLLDIIVTKATAIGASPSDIVATIEFA